MLVVGEIGTGKTSFIKRYVHQFFTTNYRATIGVDFALKVINWNDTNLVRVQLWDIAGQVTQSAHSDPFTLFTPDDFVRDLIVQSAGTIRTDDSRVLQGTTDCGHCPCCLTHPDPDLAVHTGSSRSVRGVRRVQAIDVRGGDQVEAGHRFKSHTAGRRAHTVRPAGEQVR